MAIPEWGWRGPLKGAPSWSKRSRNTKGFRISPKSDGLINRVAGPGVRPRVRRTIARAKLGGGDLAGARAMGFLLEIAWVLEALSRACSSGRAGARRLQGRGPPQQIVDQRSSGRLELRQSSVDLAARVVSPQGGDRDVDR